MTLVKDIFIGTLIAGTAYILFQKKYNNWKYTITKLKALPTGFKKLKLDSSIIKFNIDVTIVNPTNEDFKPDGIIAVLQKINIKDVVGNTIASVNVNRSYIIIPAKSKIVLKDLLVEVPIIKNILNWKNIIAIKSLNDIKLESVITVLGKEYLITN